MAYAPHRASLQTPVGRIVVEGDTDVLTAVQIGGESYQQAAAPAGSPVMRAVEQLARYFAGDRQTFDLPLAPLASDRGMALRAGMVAIPYGATVSYGVLARQLGSAARAIGQACRRNPFPIIIPCHRVTSAAGPEYYSAGDGVATKAWLIEFERAQLSLATRSDAA